MKTACCIAIVFCILLPKASAAQISDFFKMDVQSTTQGIVSLSNQPPQLKSAQKNVSLRAVGDEKSQCENYGRKSSGQADASVDVSSQDESSLVLKLATDSTSAGGHFRTCGKCIFDKCVGIFGHDTSSSVQSTASARISIKFANDLAYRFFDVKFSQSSINAAVAIKLIGPGNLIYPINVGGNFQQRINPNPGDTYFIEIESSSSAANSGGCCLDRAGSNATIAVSVLPAPILDATEKMQPFIINGKPASDDKYGSVISISVGGKLLCSGTIIGPKTVLTAAHCISGRSKEIKSGQLAIHTGIKFDSSKAGLVVIDSDYPVSSPYKFYWGKDYLEHDIGLLYISETFEQTPVPLALGLAPIRSLKGLKINFVGYGISVRVGDKVQSAGTRRVAPWTIDNSDKWTFSFAGHSGNTCSGDSGGPAFMTEKDGSLRLVGITSYGNESCRTGSDMRVDSHYAWIQPRIR